MEHIITIIPALPVISAVITQVMSGRNERQVAWISVTASIVTFMLTLVVLCIQLADYFTSINLLPHSEGLLVNDSLSAIMGVLISGISLIVHFYSIRYMAEEPGYARFFVLLDLMTAALLLMVAADDMLLLIIAWNAIGVLLYFLLGFDLRRKTPLRYAFWTFFTFRIGDIGLVIAAAILYHAYGSWSLTEIFSAIKANPGLPGVMGMTAVQEASIFLALAAFARSAQFLLHNWLPYTMDGPTPVSVLMHAGIVNAGGFLVNRFAPVFVNAADILHLLFILGLFTAIIGSVLMLSQNDIKKSLGYSTMGQMGFMIMECGVGAFSLAIYHMIAHGLFKGTLFLGAGGVIKAARKDDGVPKNELYTFVVERKAARQRHPWLVMAVLTLIIPAFVLSFAHWLVEQNFFQKQGIVVLLFFGWITGAQLIFATFRVKAEKTGRLLTMVLLSFVVVVLGYTLVSHAFEQFMYPDEQFRSIMHAASSFNVVWFDVMVIITTIIIVLGWLFTYYSEHNGQHQHRQPGRAWLIFYAMISREFYLADIYSLMSKLIFKTAHSLNIWLRWA